MTRKQYCDIFISGGGLAGLMTALSLADKFSNIICCDPNLEFDSDSSGLPQDRRVTALFNSSLDYLANLIPLEALLTDCGKRLSEIEIVEAGGKGKLIQTTSFKSHCIDRTEFGWVIPNENLRKALIAKVLQNPRITTLSKNGVEKVITRTKEAHILLSNGDRVVSRLVIGADGKNSRVRECLGINTNRISLPQSGLTFNVRHQLPLSHKSIEIYKSGGPFTIIPLPGEDKYSSNIIWMDSSKNIDIYSHMDSNSFAMEVTKRSLGMVGNIEITSPLLKWSGTYQMANKLSHERAVLIAEAAHNLPPIGAQGLNLTINDIKLLNEQLDKSEDPGDFKVLKDYYSIRYLPTLLKFVGTNFLNLMSFSNILPLKIIRKEGANIFANNRQLQSMLIKFGLGEGLFEVKPFSRKE
ncbi:MAG: FAD-dependent monooxygenase [Paracoccaceae bacterium]|nr:FAD-dependent monooxygenase [Paracoccaceae bacterium]MDE2916441.1 FAD-dependent monooxygenase [Paracoccaceae bacterium]